MSKRLIVIAGVFSYPTGMAASARMRNLAQGFIENGCRVKILATINSEENDHLVGEYKIHEGVEYTYCTLPRSESESKWQKVKRHLSPYKNMVNIFKKIIEVEKVDIVFLYGESYFLLNPLIRLAKKNHIVSMLDIVEHYEAMTPMSRIVKDPILLDLYFGFKIIPQRVDVACCITYGLLERFQKDCKATYLLPGVEAQETEPIYGVENGKTYIILYVGPLLDRDHPVKIIEIANLINERGISAKIRIIGRYNNYEVGRSWADKIRRVGGNIIEFLGEVSDEEVHQAKENADSFLLPRKNEIQEIYAFPTRLIEYLKCGKMVIISDVGDVSYYLTHLRSAFIISEDTGNSLGNLAEYIGDRSRSNEIGYNGYLIGKAHFNRKEHAQKLLEFFV